ncbi:MAG TPA: hypothetical protein VNJ08_08800 [Bacteriovoracaceae bacterium]|nr:hypothetical protein [Bacteriovoracaceae bacterium]
MSKVKGIDGGMRVEIALKRLIEQGDQDSVNGLATSLLNTLGEKKCQELAETLKDCLESGDEEE